MQCRKWIENGLHRLEIEEGYVIVKVCNKDEIERRTINHTKELFSKSKCTKAHNDKTCDVMKENDSRDNFMKGELNREECDNKEVSKFLILLKRPKLLMPDNEDEIQVNEWK